MSRDAWVPSKKSALSAKVRRSAVINGVVAVPSQPTPKGTSELRAFALTFDLHHGDLPEDIRRCAMHLEGTLSTFFVPTGILVGDRYRGALRELARAGHELGTHGHAHDIREIHALREGSRAGTAALRASRELFADCFGVAPRAFRAPAWVRMHPRCIDALHELGYHVDSSSTPQRFGIFSSYPAESPWLFSRRGIHPLRDGLVEVPTSSLVLPLGAPTFQTLRHRASLAFLRAFMLEAALRPDVAVVVQLHVPDFLDDGPASGPHPPFTWRDLLPRNPGGMAFRYRLRERRPERIAATTTAILRALGRFEAMSLSGVRARYAADRPGR